MRKWIPALIVLVSLAVAFGTCAIGGDGTRRDARDGSAEPQRTDAPRPERVRAGGVVPDAPPVVHASPRPDDPVPAMTTVRVTVLSESDGAPIGNALVRVRSRAADFDVERRTGADGTLVVERVPIRGHEIMIDATADGFVADGEMAGVRAVADAAGGVLPFVVRLAEGGTVEGRVTGPGGEPVPKVRVKLEDARECVIAETRADAAGRFALNGVRLGVAYLVTCESDAPEWARDGQPRLCPPEEPVAVELTRASRKAQVELTMRACGAVVVRVVLADGSPAPLASVELVSDDRHRSARVEGGTRTFLVEAGTYRVSASAKDSAAEAVPVTVAEAGTEEVTLRLTSGASIEGVVVDARGAPLPDVQVLATWRDPADRFGSWNEAGVCPATDRSGRFRIAGLRTGVHEIATWRDDLPRVEIRHDVPVAALRIVVPDWSRIRFRLRAPAGVAIPEPLPVELGVPSLDGDSTGRWPAEAVRTGDVWEVRCAPDTRQLVIRRDDFPVSSVAVRPEPGAVFDAGTIVLDSGVAYRGRVVDESGNAVPGAEVRAWDAAGSGGGGYAKTSSDGAFALEHLGRDIAWLEVSVAGHVTTHVAAEAPRDDLTITVARGVVVTGRVVDAQGAPVRSAWVSAARVAVTSAGGLGGWVFTDAAGGFSTRVPVGRAHLVARAESGARGAADCDAGTAGASGVTIRVE